MKLLLLATVVSLALIASSVQAQETKVMPKSMLTREDIRMVAPALDQYTQDRLLGDIWKRPGLTPRDRSIVTLAALIARNQAVEMPYHFNLALDNGVKPREISEIITHLAFYTGWANAMSAVAVAKDVFAERKIGADQLPAASPSHLPLDQAAEAQRASPTSPLALASCTASEFASRIAWAAPLPPKGYIGWAASPISVTRPKLHRGKGLRLAVRPLMARGRGEVQLRPPPEKRG